MKRYEFIISRVIPNGFLSIRPIGSIDGFINSRIPIKNSVDVDQNGRVRLFGMELTRGCVTFNRFGELHTVFRRTLDAY